MGEKVQVIVISAGGEARSESCEMACRTERVRRVVHLRDQALDETDFLSTGRVLAEAARHLEARVVLLGEHSDDEGEGLVPAALAHHWHAPLLACVREVQPPSGDEVPWEVTVRASGSLCKVRSTPPLVLAVPPAFAWATATEGKQAMREVETLSLAQLGIEASDLVPRPDLLGALVAPKGERVENKSFEETAQLILRR
jgi:electron transfer flavoprotein alpha/beta subunit